jgi:hypothetical protein
MNKREHLLADTLGSPDGALFARQAALHVRRRRVLKHVVSGTAALAAALALFVTPRQPPPIATARAVPSPTLAAAVEIISDEELLTALEHESVLLVKDHAGITDVVFLAGADPVP